MPRRLTLQELAEQREKAKAKAKAEGKKERARAKAKAAPKMPKSSKYPWPEVEAFFVHGEEATGANGSPFRTQPTTSETARKFRIPVTTVSQRANTKDGNGKTWYAKRNEYLQEFSAQRDSQIAEEIVDQEIAFRKATLTAAQMVVQHSAIQLHRGLRRDTEGNIRSALDPDALCKLAASAKKGQEIGMVAMDRPANGPDGGSLGAEDWVRMREIRRGARPVPALNDIEGEKA